MPIRLSFCHVGGVLLVAALISSCNYSEPPPRPSPERPEVVAPGAPELTAPSRRSPKRAFGLAYTHAKGRKLAAFDLHTGRTLHASAAAPFPDVLDLCCDVNGRRALAYEADLNEQGGELATYGLITGPQGTRLGQRTVRAWIAGYARLWPMPEAIAVFEIGDDGGQRWKWLRDDSRPTRSLAAPSPHSLWLEADTIQPIVVALVTHAQSLQLWRALGSSEGLVRLSTQDLGLPTADPATVRVAPLDGRKRLLASLAGASLRFVVLGAPQPITPKVVPLTANNQRVIALKIVRSEPGLLVAAVLLGTPSELVVVRFAPPLEHAQSVSMAIPGEALPSERFFSRALALSGKDRLLVGTATGLWAVKLHIDDSGLRVFADGSFDGSKLSAPFDICRDQT